MDAISAISDALVAVGFKKRKKSLYKISNQGVILLEFQKSAFSVNSVFLNFGIYFQLAGSKKGVPARCQDCQLQGRFNQLIGSNMPEDVLIETAIEESKIEKLIERIIDVCLPYLELCTQKDYLIVNREVFDFNRLWLQYYTKDEFIHALQAMNE